MINHQKMHKEKGSMMVLFAGFLLPLTFLLVSVAVEVQAYSTVAEKTQDIVDEAALYASRYLPDMHAAERAGEAMLAGRIPEVATSIAATSDSVGIKADGIYQPFLASYFSGIIGTSLAVPYHAQASSRGNPFDVFIAIDRSAYLAPELSQDDDDAWGDIGNWGAASTFTQALSIPYETGTLDSRIATQQCFNPKFSLIKKSALAILDFMGAYTMNRVGVSFFPGATRFVGRTRPMNAGIGSSETTYFYDSHIDWDIDHYVTVEEKEDATRFLVQSTYCASTAEHEPFYQEYHIPPLPGFLEPHEINDELINQATWEVNPDYPLSSREVIWSRAVNKAALMDFEMVLSEVEYSLFGAGSHDARGGLVDRITQAAFVLTDRAPLANGERFEHAGDAASMRIHDQLDRIRALKANDSTKLTIYYLMYGGSAGESAELASFFEAEKLVTNEGKVIFEIRVIRGEDTGVVLSNLLSALILENRGNVLSE